MRSDPIIDTLIKERGVAPVGTGRRRWTDPNWTITSRLRPTGDAERDRLLAARADLRDERSLD